MHLKLHSSMLSALLLFIVCAWCVCFGLTSEVESLYDVPGEVKYEWEILQKNTIRYTDRLKALRRHEAKRRDDGLEIERYTWPLQTSDGKSFECSVPYVNPMLQDEEKEEDLSNTAVSPFLKSLRSACIFRWEGWWTYEFCYGKHIRQFHQEQDATITAQYFLGHDRESSSVEGVANVDYYSEQYYDGTVCSLTGKPRVAELRFYCEPNSDVSVLASIKEPSTCSYVVRIDTSLLCKHPKYSAKLEEDTEKILCFESPVPTVEEMEAEDKRVKSTGASTTTNFGTFTVVSTATATAPTAAPTTVPAATTIFTTAPTATDAPATAPTVVTAEPTTAPAIATTGPTTALTTAPITNPEPAPTTAPSTDPTTAPAAPTVPTPPPVATPAEPTPTSTEPPPAPINAPVSPEPEPIKHDAATTQRFQQQQNRKNLEELFEQEFESGISQLKSLGVSVDPSNERRLHDNIYVQLHNQLTNLQSQLHDQNLVDQLQRQIKQRLEQQLGNLKAHGLNAGQPITTSESKVTVTTEQNTATTTTIRTEYTTSSSSSSSSSSSTSKAEMTPEQKEKLNTLLGQYNVNVDDLDKMQLVELLAMLDSVSWQMDQIELDIVGADLGTTADEGTTTTTPLDGPVNSFVDVPAAPLGADDQEKKDEL